jgi:hypothetical protein
MWIRWKCSQRWRALLATAEDCFATLESQETESSRAGQVKNCLQKVRQQYFPTKIRSKRTRRSDGEGGGRSTSARISTVHVLVGTARAEAAAATAVVTSAATRAGLVSSSEGGEDAEGESEATEDPATTGWMGAGGVGAGAGTVSDG